MDARLEAALLDVLERTAGGPPPDDDWLRAAHPQHWREIRAVLDFQAQVAGGAPAGAAIGPYRLLQRLGRGGAGTVYLAHAPGGRAVAVKVLHPHLVTRPGFVERAMSEARAAAAIDHPNVARTLDAGVDEDAPPERRAYVVTEYVEGQNLRGLLDDLGPLPEALVLHLAAEVLRGLAAIHAAGAVHGDLKPENVLIGPDDSVKVVDVGLGVSTPSSPRTDSPGFQGTALYAAPERLASGVVPDGRSDLFSLGVMADELLAGIHPHGSRRAARTAAPPSAFLRAFVATLRAPRREDRFVSADEALAAAAGGPASAWWRARSKRAAGDAPRGAWSGPCAGAASLHGRTAETTRLALLLDEAGRGSARDVVVEGEAGIGKTRFVAEFAAAAHARGVLVVWCGHDAARGSDALASALCAAHAAYGFDLAAHAAAAGDLGPALVAWIAGRTPAEPPLAGASRAVAAGALLRALARERTVLLVADDLHLAADEDRALVGALASQLRDARALVVATARPSGAEACRRALPRAAGVELAGLRVQEVDAVLAETLASDAIARRLAPEIHRRTAGNPLAVLEEVDALRADGALVRAEDGTWTLRDVAAPAAGPAPARQLLARRLAALAAADRAVLELAACQGPRFDPAVVARALGRDAGRVVLRLARLERRRLVRIALDDATFEHHEVRDAVLDAMTEDAVRERHAAVGAALEAACGDRGGPSPRESFVIARHFLAAADGPRTAPHLALALDWLDLNDRATDAIEFCGAALATAGAVDDSVRARLLLVRGAGYQLTSRHDDAVRTLDDAAEFARARGDGALARSAANLAAQTVAEGARIEEAEARGLAIVADAAAAGDAVAEESAHGTLAGLLLNRGRHDEGVRHAERRHALSRGSGDPRREGEGETGLAMARVLTSRHEEALALFASGIAKLRAAPAAAVAVVPALGNYGVTLAGAGRREEAVAAHADAARLARGMGNVRAEVNSLGFLAMNLRLLARLDEARPHVERALDVVADAGGPAIDVGLAWCAGAHRDAEGRTADALALFERSRFVARETGDPHGAVFALRMSAAVHGRLGDAARASAVAAEAAALAREAVLEFAVLLADWALARWVTPGREPDIDAMRRATTRAREIGRDDGAVHLLLDAGRLEWSRSRRAEAAVEFEAAREIARRLELRDVGLACDAHLAAREGGAADVARRLDAGWTGLSLWTRVEAAGLVARAARAPGLLDRAREDVASAVAWAPAECREALRARLERQLEESQPG